MPGGLLMPSPVRFSRRMFWPFWTRLFKSSWGGVCVSVVCLGFFPSPAILGFVYLWLVLGPMSSQFQWEVLAWEKVLPNIWLKLASVVLGKTQFDGCFPADAKILCSFSRLFWRNASGEDYCSEDPGGFYRGALSPLTCFFCLWAHRLLQYTQLRAWYSNTFFLSKKYRNSSDTPVLLPVVAKMTWDFVTTSWEIWGGEEVEDCCFCVSFLC